MGTIRKRFYKKDWNYVLDFIVNGKRYQVTTGTKDRRLADKILHELTSRVAQGIYLEKTKKKKDISFQEFMKEYLVYAAAQKQKSTVDLERTYIRKTVELIGNKTLRAIDQRDVDRWQAQLLAKLSVTSCNIILRTLRQAFNVAKRWHYVDENPFAHLSQLKPVEKRLFFLDDELKRIFQVIDEDVQNAVTAKGGRENIIRFRKVMRLLVEFLLNTGLRREEALRLRQDNIDFSRNVMYIEKTKTKQMRAIPLNRKAREVLQELGDDLFSKLNKHDVSGKFHVYLDRAGLGGFKLHSLRHTFATRLLALGVDIYTISRLLGHTDIKTTMIYAKTDVEMLRGVVEKLDESTAKTCDAIATWTPEKEKGQ
jgi:integrase